MRVAKPAAMARHIVTAALLLASAAAAAAPAPLVPALRSSFPTRKAAVAAMAPFLAGAPAGPTAAARNPTYDFQVKRLWQLWKQQYGVQFKGRQEDAYRYSVFRRNVQRIWQANSQNGAQSWQSINKFAAMTREERLATYGSPQPPYITNPERPRKPLLGNPIVPLTWDWRSKGVTTPVKDQGSCNTCFAFTAAAQIESYLLIKEGKTFAQRPIDASEQQIVDCNSPTGNGCRDGGYLETGIEYAGRPGVFVTSEARYPYRMNSGACRFDSIKAGVPAQDQFSLRSPGWAELTKWDAVTLREEVYKAPVAIGMLGPGVDAFDSYGGGILPARICRSIQPAQAPTANDYADINHAMLVVGFDRSTVPNYWIIRNSWGAGWGEGGYIRVEMTGNNTWGTCNMYYNMVKILEK
ncbi:senescence-specific cysteine protease SAG12-like [Chlorella sorokiniana]|uniref:Senescence-specific cysteine protease SAG12-like n=1 Tax=Chlorella sorokiniana TaxID=3076 RepID=A0A2P6TZ93_CHLSO|nr:senescence-specific cysteine protease SAG12-like [Chlorella sorokiniana]|eukprot:PRW59388.1 senescence-specific cysteine protease SAG12-like [Chlorella sorokiniana]